MQSDSLEDIALKEGVSNNFDAKLSEKVKSIENLISKANNNTIFIITSDHGNNKFYE